MSLWEDAGGLGDDAMAAAASRSRRVFAVVGYSHAVMQERALALATGLFAET